MWDDATRIRAVRRGRWVATAPFHGVAGFRINELVSPFPGSNMAELVKKWLTADKALREGDDTKMRSFVNNSQGRAYKYKTDLPELDVLAQRALPYAELTVPLGGLVLTLGVDVQHDRLAVVVRAWGRGEESYVERNDHPDIRCVFDGFHIETVPIQYTVGGGRGVERNELIIFSWDDAAQPVGLF
ncbi:TPA: terminase gpA endonuclease subunit [Burkholderia cenocepacia]